MTYSVFTPYVVLISNITQGQTTIVTFSSPHGFVLNENIGLRVSRPYGMVEINNQTGKVIALDALTVTLNIDSTNYTSFTTPASVKGTTPPCAVPSSSGIDFSTYDPTVILNDVFDNVPA